MEEFVITWLIWEHVDADPGCCAQQIEFRLHKFLDDRGLISHQHIFDYAWIYAMIAFPADILHIFMYRSFNDAMAVFF